MRSGCSSLIPALTRSPASAACPVQTCFTSMAVTNQTTKTRTTFDCATELFMKLIFILGASSTRCPVILCIKACHMQPVSPSHFQKARRSLRIRRSHFLTCHLSCLLSVVPWLERPGLSDTSRLALWLTGGVKTAGVTSNTWQHIYKCVFGWSQCKFGLIYNALPNRVANALGNMII